MTFNEWYMVWILLVALVKVIWPYILLTIGIVVVVMIGFNKWLKR
jgi:hypothetical protein